MSIIQQQLLRSYSRRRAIEQRGNFHKEAVFTLFQNLFERGSG